MAYAVLIWEWHKRNWKPILTIFLLVCLRLSVYLTPNDFATREMIVQIANVLDLFGVATIPALASIERDK